MKSFRIAFSALLAVSGGALLALEPSGRWLGLAIASDPANYPNTCLQESPAAVPSSDVAGNEAPSHFDNGPVPGDELAGQPGENQGDYRFEYPESTSPEASTAQADGAEHYYPKYGYPFASPGAPYGGDAGSLDISSTTKDASICQQEERHAAESGTTAEDYTYDRKNFSDSDNATTSNAGDAANDLSGSDNTAAATGEPKTEGSVETKNDAGRETAPTGPVDDMKDEAVATSDQTPRGEQRDGAGTQPDAPTTNTGDATGDSSRTYHENPPQGYGYQYGYKYGYRYGYEPSTTDPQVGGDASSANSSDVPAQETQPVESDADVNAGYQGHSAAYPDENYAYREPASSTDGVSDAGVASEQADAALVDELESKYQFSRRRYGEPGESLGRMFEEEPNSYYAVPTSEYDGFDYYAEEVRQAKAANAIASSEEPAGDVAGEAAPNAADTLDKRTESVDQATTPETSASAAQDQTAMSNANASETNDSDAHAGENLSTSPESGLELFAWNPTDLLLGDDQRLLRQLERLCEEPLGVRQAALDTYLESLGMEAMAFARRFEDATSIEVRSLADDLPGTAAFLASYRLVEQGELGMDEAVDVARRSLRAMPGEWIAGVRGIATRPEEICTPQYAEAPVQEAVASQPVQESRDASRVCGALQQAAVNVFTDMKTSLRMETLLESIPTPQWRPGQ